MTEPNPNDVSKPEATETQTPAPETDPAKLALEYAKASRQIAELNRDQEKLRKRLAEKDAREANLIKLLTGEEVTKETAGNIKPEVLLAQREEETRKRKEAERDFQLNLAVALSRSNLAPKDNDLEYLFFKLGKDEFSEVRSSNDVTKALEVLKEKGLVTGSEASSTPKTLPELAKPKSTASPDSEAASVKTMAELAAKGAVYMAEFQKKYPARYQELLSLKRLGR